MKRKIVALFSIINLTLLSQPGSLDLSFDAGAGAGNNWVKAIAVQNDGKIILGGAFTSFASSTQNRLVRVNNNGTVDNTYNIGTGPSSWVECIVNLSNNNSIIAGDFNSYNGTNRNYIAGVNSSGGLDASFTPSAIPGSYVNDIALQSDGKIVVGGIFSKAITRLNSNGTLDAIFNNGTGADDWVETVAVQSDGKILIGGIFLNYNGVTRNRIARLNADGTLDNSFDPLAGASSAVRDICVQPDGKIIVVGEFTTFNGISSSRIVRLNTNGSVDNSFNVGTGASGNILSCELQSDNKIIIGGNFTTYNGNSSSRLARLNDNGGFDNSFNVGSGANGTVRKLTLQSNGAIVIGGDFTSYNGITRNRVARVLGGNATSIKNQENNLSVNVFPNPCQNQISIDLPKGAIDVGVFSVSGQNIVRAIITDEEKNQGFLILNTSELKSGIYYVKTNGVSGNSICKIVKL